MVDEIIPSVTEEYYEISGNNADELNAQVRAKGPMEEEGDGVRRYAVTDWRIVWNVQIKKVGSDFAIKAVDVTLRILYRVPKRLVPSGHTDRFERQWRTFMAALMVHEHGHAAIGLEHAEMVRSALMQPKLFSSMLELNRFNFSEGLRVMARGRQANATYDLQTSHGLSQGAVLH